MRAFRDRRYEFKGLHKVCFGLIVSTISSFHTFQYISFSLLYIFHLNSSFPSNLTLKYWLSLIFASGVEEETVGCSGEWRRCRGKTMQKHGDPVRVSSAGPQVYSQFLLRLRHEERVGVN